MVAALVIEDDDLMRDMLVAWLARLGHSSRTAENGRVGLGMFREAPAELVLCDLVMPDMEGIETIRTLRREAPAVRIVAMSGGFASRSADYLKMARALGADEVLPKPFRLADLAEAIDRTGEGGVSSEGGAASGREA